MNHTIGDIRLPPALKMNPLIWVHLSIHTGNWERNARKYKNVEMEKSSPGLLFFCLCEVPPSSWTAHPSDISSSWIAAGMDL